MQYHKKSLKFTVIDNERGYVLIIVTLIGLVLAIIFGNILPKLHKGQQIRAITNLNDYRAYEAAIKGINAVRFGLNGLQNFQELIGSSSGILLAIEQVFGTAVVDDTTKDLLIHDEYRDEDNNIQFVSGCLGLDASTVALPNERGMLHIAVIISRGGTFDPTTADDDTRFNDHIYFYNNGMPGQDGSAWLSIDNNLPVGAINWSHYDELVSGVRYCDFDLTGLIPWTYQDSADFKYEYEGGFNAWRFAIGNNGTWRGRSGVSELWNIELTIPSGYRPFQGKDNDGIGGGGQLADEVEIFIIVRSIGITVAPGDNYNTDKRSGKLINEVPNSTLSSPMRQVLEAGFYLTEEETSPGSGIWVLKTKRFYFSQAHNLED